MLRSGNGRQNALTHLGDLATGETAVVARILADPPATTGRCAARGIAPGVAVTVLRQGDPILVALDRSRWAIDRREASAIGVARLAGGGG